MTQISFDVLYLLCSLLTEVPDVLSFSLTCSALRPVAVERRLSMRAITISSAESIRNLYNFIFVDEEQRGQHIRALTVPVHSNSPSSSKELVDYLLAILRSARRVRTFSLCVPGRRPQSLFCDPRLLAAVAEMASLRELNVVAPLGLAANGLLWNVPSALKTLRYSETYDGHQGLPPCLYIAPWLAATLEEIELPFDFTLLRLVDDSHVSFPAVRSLVLKRVYSVLDLDILLTMFPNLDRAFIIDDAFLVPFCNLRLADRDENRERASARKLLPWKSLDRVFADPDILHSLGLDCPVRHLTLSMRRDDGDQSFRACSGNNVPTVLREHAPTHLALVGITLPDGLSHLDDMLYPNDAGVASRITHLVLDAAYKNVRMARNPANGIYETTNASAPWDVVLDTVLRGLEVLPNLTHVRVIFGCEVNSGYSFCAPLYNGARRFKFYHLVAALHSTIPSLTHIFITSTGRSYKDVDAGGRREEEEKWSTSRA